jgi:putative hydrolase of the HAD superfamily
MRFFRLTAKAVFRYTVPMCGKFSAVAFDLDGTLYPNYRLNARLLPFLCRHWPLLAAMSMARTIIRREQEKSPSSAMPNFYEHQAQLSAKMLFAKPEKVREKIDSLIYSGWESLFSRIKMFPHVQTVLRELRAAGLKLGMLSDFPPQIKLENLGIADCWDAVLCSETVGALKPAMPPFLELANILGIPPGQILYVGNSRSYDVAGAKRAGMKTALLSREKWFRAKPKADFTFHDYRQLRDFVLQ